MTPLTDDEKTAIVATFRTLRSSIDTGTDVGQAFRAFQAAYRGDQRAFVDGFPSDPTKNRQWAGQLEIHLTDEIEARFWDSTARAAE